MPQNKRKGVGTGTSTPRSTGAYGSKRGKHALAKERRRAGDRRVQTALEKARAEEAALNARIAAEREATAPEPAQPGGLLTETRRKLPTTVTRPRPTKLVVTPSPAEQEAARWRKGETAWTLGDARQMVTQGYSLARVVRRTGWGEGWFDDLRNVRP